GVPGVVDATKNRLDSGLPRITINGGYALLGAATNLPQGRITNTYELLLNATHVAQFNFTRHTVKVGYNIRREETRRFLDGNSRGSMTFPDWDHFAGTCSDCNGQSLLLTSTIRTGDTLSHWYRYAHAFYFQDDVKVKPNFSVSFGLRYELPSVVTEKRGKGSNFIPGYGPVLIGTNQLLDIDPTKRGRDSFVFRTVPFTLPRAGANPDNKDFGPMFGFAYSPHFGKGPSSEKTVIRGGFRLSYDEVFNNIPVNQSLNAPFVLTTVQRTGLTQPSIGYGWNLAFDQNVPLVVSGKVRMRHSLTMNSSYTWSHAIDNASSFFGADNDISQPADSRNLRAERGNSGNDQRHRFLNAFTLDLPVGQGRRFLASAHG